MRLPLFLISLSDFLSDRRTIQKSAIEEMVRILEPDLAENIDNFKGYHRFRETLKGKYNKMMSIDKDAISFSNIILNKSKYRSIAGNDLDPKTCHVFLCGNPGMISQVETQLIELGFTSHSRKQPGNIHFERYW